MGDTQAEGSWFDFRPLKVGLHQSPLSGPSGHRTATNQALRDLEWPARPPWALRQSHAGPQSSQSSWQAKETQGWSLEMGVS